MSRSQNINRHYDTVKWLKSQKNSKCNRECFIVITFLWLLYTDIETFVALYSYMMSLMYHLVKRTDFVYSNSLFYYSLFINNLVKFFNNMKFIIKNTFYQLLFLNVVYIYMFAALSENLINTCRMNKCFLFLKKKLRNID